jgi:uncharacterized protein (UPF0276 family)
MPNRFNIPYLGFGLGLRDEHYDDVLTQLPKAIDWFEIISENYLDAHQGYWDFLADLRRDYPLVMHGVSLSIGSPDPLNMDYLQKLRRLADHLRPPYFSDHLCWTGMNAHNTHDLLPLVYDAETLARTTDKIKQIQDFMGLTFALENPSTYLQFKDSTMPEWEFMAELAQRADCAILLDVNNIYVSAFNHDFDAVHYIDVMPADRIVQIHLAGHQNLGTHIIDTHDDHVIDAVWDLYAQTVAAKGSINTMIEWDDKIPPFPVLVAELEKARAHVAQSRAAA